MLYVILGQKQPFNNYVFEDIEKNYLKNFRRSYTTIGELLSDVSKTYKPLIGGKYVFSTSLKMKNTEYTRFLLQIENLYDHPYIDFILNILPNGIVNATDKENLKVINLFDTMDENFKSFVSSDLLISEKGLKTLINRIGYSYTKYILYREDLKSLEDPFGVRELQPNDITKVIKEKRVKNPEDILFNLIKGDITYLKHHHKLVDRYSSRWVFEYYQKTIFRALKIKEKVRNGKNWMDLKNESPKIFKISEFDFIQLKLISKLLNNPEKFLTYIYSNYSKQDLFDKIASKS